MRVAMPLLSFVLATQVAVPVFAHKPSLQECFEGGDFIANAAQARDNGVTRSAFVDRLVANIALIIIGLAHGTNVVLGLDPVEQAMLLLTLFVSTITYTSGRTNVLQGAVHVMLLLVYLMLIIWH